MSESDVVERLRELEAVESELACECDCPPEATANYRYAMTCAEAADIITTLRAKVEKLEGALNNPDMVLMPRYPTPRMIYAGEGITDFMLPNDTHDNTPDGRRAEMRGAYLTMVEEWERERAALGDTHE